MLNDKDKEKSFSNLRNFIYNVGGNADNFQGNFNVLVENDNEYLDKNTEIIISYNYGYMDYKIVRVLPNCSTPLYQRRYFEWCSNKTLLFHAKKKSFFAVKQQNSTSFDKRGLSFSSSMNDPHIISLTNTVRYSTILFQGG